MRSRVLTVVVAMTFFAVACGNATSSKPEAVATTEPGAAPITEVSGAALKENVPLDGVPGVTSSEIRVATITAGTNPVAGDFRTFADGIQAYFNMVNAAGGIYGRRLVIASNRDDEFINNQQTVKASLAEDHAFATFIATALFGGAPDIAASKPPMPTFTWNINQEFVGKPNIFGTMGAICFACQAQIWPYLAQEMNFTRVAILGYGGIAASKHASDGFKASFEKYPSAKVVYFDPNMQVGQPNVSAEVSRMKDAGVQLVFTAIDQQETLILAKEMAKQHLNAVQYVNNLYNAKFARDNAGLLEGALVAPQFAALENTPQLEVEKDFVAWMGKSGKPVSELAAYGWISALQFVHGLKLAGATFSQQKLIDALNRETRFDADGMIVPIDWTKQHNDPSGPNGTANAYAGDYQCISLTRVHDGAFVPVFTAPDKPFTCMGGGRNVPALTKTATHMSFADDAG